MELETNVDKSIEILETNQTVVTIEDSDEEAYIVDDKNDIEDGEVVGDAETNENNFLFQVEFKNSEIFNLYKTLLAQTLENAFKGDNNCIKFEVDDKELRLLAYARENIDQQSNALSVSEIERKRKSESKSPDLTGIKELFTIDTLPSEKPDLVQVPSYKRSIKHVLDVESVASKRQKTEDTCQRIRAACFNCGLKDHIASDCQKPRNSRRIQNAIKSFKRTSDQRYHQQEGPYPHLRPGVISSQLKRALGLRSGALPFFYYRMRVLGYPPGWLEDAKVKHSGLTLFSADGTKDAMEKDENVHNTRDKFDVSKIIDFPGFNVKPTTKFFDDYQYHNVPPMNPNHMKGEFINSLGDNVIKGYKRKKITNFPNENDLSASDVVCIEPTDMEVVDTDDDVIEISEDIEPPLTTDTAIDDKCEISETKNEHEENNDIANEPETVAVDDESTETRTPSPTIADLEAQQNALLAALGDEKTTDASLETSIIDEEKPEEISLIEDVIECETPTRTEYIIKESHAGTPLLKFSPFDKLPSGDKFKVGVSDVINFENLPDSVGKYEQMKIVIKKVRNKVKKLNEEN